MNTLLVELRTEELPPKALARLGEAFAEELRAALARERLLTADSRLAWYATPRRLAVSLTAVRAQAPEQTVSEKIMPVAVALDAQGRPTPALMKKLTAKGIPLAAVERFERRMEGKSETLFYTHTAPGSSLAAVLQEAIAEAVRRLPIPKLMRWGGGEAEFVRPVHGLIALHGREVVPCTLFGLHSGRVTRGHRFMGAGELVLERADDYAGLLRTRGFVEPDFAARRERIRAALLAAAGAEQVLITEALLDEVTALTEWPVVLKGTFDAAFLSVPQECLILTMQSHQRYFPLLDANGRLLPRFLLVANIDVPEPGAIVQGNERVLRARLSDARFFFEQDSKTPLAARVPRLDEVVYHNRLGSQGERVRRLKRLAAAIARELNADVALTERAAELAKADLVTDMVGEFPELQGVMGRYYALNDGEDARVAEAIETHYRPRLAGDALPEGNIAVSLALADRLDQLVGLFGIGLVPTGDKDPYALRRAALGALRLLLERALPLDLMQLLRLAHAQFHREQLTDSAPLDVYQFMLERLRVYLREQGHPADAVEAVLALAPTRIDQIPARLDAVVAFQRLPEAAALAAAHKRIRNLLKKAQGADAQIDPALLAAPAERALYDVLVTLEPKVMGLLADLDYTGALLALAGVRAPVDRFFDEVMVLVEEPLLRANRLALLRRLHGVMNSVADIAELAAAA
ncbi:MAG: glycine--tRNA ligase subunit beta [Burkholderiales bacterium]|nr:glycine--tRNA ligase subunit beta [Burkholderiales bacterium]